MFPNLGSASIVIITAFPQPMSHSNEATTYWLSPPGQRDKWVFFSDEGQEANTEFVTSSQ